jgi:hypothetical protein
VVSVPGLRTPGCQSTNCTPALSQLLPWVAPRFSFELQPARTFSLGVFASTDLLPRTGDDFSVGTYLSIHAPRFGL